MNPVNPEFVERFQIMYQKDPNSRVFAPLAECYRKMGLLDEALRLCLVIGLMYAALDELHQILIPMRECSIYDFTADAAGILAGAISAWQYYRKKCMHEKTVTALRG